MVEAVALERQLLQAQNSDGGWPYQRGSSWTEPTAFALLALAARNGTSSSAYERGTRWLERHQRADGGWMPHPAVPVSTWVTSLAVLASSQNEIAADPYRRAVEWLVAAIRTAPRTMETLVYRIRRVPPPVQVGGSPWFPGTAAWIGPTSISVLALGQAARRFNDSQLWAHVRAGQEYILCRRCRDGGWNHGGSRYLSENAASYPEMTGMALLALYGVPAPELNVSLTLAEARLESPGSSEALSWLQLALTRHGRQTPLPRMAFPCHNTRDASLRLLALSASSGTNRLLSAL